MASGITIYGAAGLVGVFLYLGSYGALQLGLIRGSTQTYTLLNLIAAASILFSLLENWNLFSALIQIFWIAISMVGIGRRIWLRARLSFTDEERDFLAAHLPALPPIEAHRVMRHGRWEDHEPGARLSIQGERLGSLVFLSSGAAEVWVDGRSVARLAPGALIGEMTVMHGGPATADVCVSSPARVLTLPRERLLAEVDASPEIALALGQALQTEMQRKLQAMNQTGGQRAVPDPA